MKKRKDQYVFKCIFFKNFLSHCLPDKNILNISPKYNNIVFYPPILSYLFLILFLSAITVLVVKISHVIRYFTSLTHTKIKVKRDLLYGLPLPLFSPTHTFHIATDS